MQEAGLTEKEGHGMSRAKHVDFNSTHYFKIENSYVMCIPFYIKQGLVSCGCECLMIFSYICMMLQVKGVSSIEIPCTCFADNIGISPNTIRRYIETLQTIGYIKMKSGTSKLITDDYGDFQKYGKNTFSLVGGDAVNSILKFAPKPSNEPVKRNLRVVSNPMFLG